MTSKKELRDQIASLKFDLNSALQSRDRAEELRKRAEDRADRREVALLKLGLIPEKFTKTATNWGGFFTVETYQTAIDWRAVEQAGKDLEAYRAAERGKEIANETAD